MQPSKNLIPVVEGDRFVEEDRLKIEYLVNPEAIAEVEKALNKDIIKGLTQSQKNSTAAIFL